MLFSYANLSCRKKIDINERNKGRNSDILKKVYSIGHNFTT